MTTDIAPLTTEPAAEPEAGLGALATSRGNLPLETVDVRAAIAGLSASVELTQGFRNPFDVPLEATYIFPLPDRAAVTAMRMEAAGHVVEAAAEGALPGRGRTTTRRSRQGGGRRSPRRSGRTCSPCESATSPRRAGHRPAHAGAAAAVRGRRGDVPVPAGGRAPLHPGPPARRRAGWQRRGRRHRRRPRRVPDQPAGAAARVPEPGPARDERRYRPGRAAAGGDPLQPARHRGGGCRGRPHHRPAAAGRAAGPGLHPAAGGGRPRPDRDVAGAHHGLREKTQRRARSPSPSCRQTAMAARGRATWCWCSTAPAACAAGRWWRPAAPPPGSWTR